MTWKLHRRKK